MLNPQWYLLECNYIWSSARIKKNLYIKKEDGTQSKINSLVKFELLKLKRAVGLIFFSSYIWTRFLEIVSKPPNISSAEKIREIFETS